MMLTRDNSCSISAAVVTGCLLSVLSASALAQETQPSGATVTLNGAVVRIQWSDGDSFRFLDGEYADRGVRLSGFNTLESYGPVHRWGDWTPAELAEVAAQATAHAQSAHWNCVTEGETDNYDRVLVTCDDLTVSMLELGLGHLFAVGALPPVEHIAAQRAAQAASLGMWAKGLPPAIVTSLHSIAEGRDFTYNRVVSTTDGSSSPVAHEETYEVCQEVCLRGSCLIYVPYEQRYGNDRPACLR